MTISHDGLPHRALSALVEASSSINNSLDLQTTLHAIGQTASTVMEAEASSVMLLDAPRNKLVFAAATGAVSKLLVGQEFDAHLGIAGKVIRTGKPILVTDVRMEESFFKGIDEQLGFTTRGMVAAPLVAHERVIGVVEVINKIGQQNFSPDDMELIQVFANLAASGATNAQAHERLKQENRGLRATQVSDVKIIGHSVALQEVLDLCARVAGSNATVLLLGETGTGKELICRHIHNNSPRQSKPFVAINCAALPETLLESELFGHEKGAFTGAHAQKIGRFELADGGTLFLDEIGDISQATQLKLLRILQEREFVRVGGSKTVACDVRILAATNRDLTKAIEDGRFREDFYYRLNVFPINLPPLRERQEDIPLLVEHFVRLASKQLGVVRRSFSSEAMAMLTRYRWPGNIRELQNVVERAVLLCDSDAIGPTQLPREITGDTVAPQVDTKDSSLWGYEKALIINALKEHGWNQTRAARALGISRDNLRYRAKKYDIKRPE